MPLRHFDPAGSDKITLAIGSLGFAMGPGTIAMILRKSDDAGTETPFIAGVSAIGARYSLEFGSDVLVARAGSGTVLAPTISVLAAEGLAFVAWSKTSGTTQPRFHHFDFGTGTWTHENGVASIGNSGTPATSAFFGGTSAGANFFHGDIGIAAVWNSVLSDAAIEALVVEEPAWPASSPIAYWPPSEFGDASTLQDTVGAADQTAITGTTVVAGDIPWTGGVIEYTLTPATTVDEAQALDYSVDAPSEYELTPAGTTDQAQTLDYSVDTPIELSITPATTNDEAQELIVRSGISVVTRPPPRPVEVLSDWIFELARSDDLSKIGRLTEARSRSLTLTQDLAGSFSASLPLTHSLSREIEIAKTCVLCKKSGQIVWSGPVWTLEKSAPGDLSIGCVGWLQTLGKRVTKPSWIADGKLSYTSTDAGLIAHSVLNRSAEDMTDGPIYVTSGSLQTTQIRSQTYQPFSSVLSIIMGLSAEEIEAGYFLNVHPVARTLDIYATIGRVRPHAVFTYGSSAATISQAFDADRLCNRFIAYSAIGWAQADNLISQATYGVFEEAQSLSDVQSLSILQAYANGEVAVRSDPLGFLAFTGAPSTFDGPRVPRIFEDFVIGDTVQVAGRRGALDVPRQPTRVYSATLNWPDKGGREVLSSVQTIASGS